MTDPDVTLWGSSDPDVVTSWGAWAADADWQQYCPDGSTPSIIERDGQQYPSCLATGIFYAPPFLQAILADLAFPGDWDIVPPG